MQSINQIIDLLDNNLGFDSLRDKLRELEIRDQPQQFFAGEIQEDPDFRPDEIDEDVFEEEK